MCIDEAHVFLQFVRSKEYAEEHVKKAVALGDALLEAAGGWVGAGHAMRKVGAAVTLQRVPGRLCDSNDRPQHCHGDRFDDTFHASSFVLERNSNDRVDGTIHAAR